MPTVAQYFNRQIEEILTNGHFLTYDSRMFDAAACIGLNANNERLIYPGMIVSISSVTNNYRPYSATAAYGAGTDVPIGILRDFHNCTLGDKAIEPIVHARVPAQRCYIYGQAPGAYNIPAGVRAALNQIVWDG